MKGNFIIDKGMGVVLCSRKGIGPGWKNGRVAVRKLFVILIVLLMGSGAGCSGFSRMPTPTITPKATGTAAATPTRTATHTRAPTRTPTTDPAYTAMLTLVDDLYQQGYISTTEGTFHRLDDYHESEALNLYLFYDPLDDAPTNFVLTSDIWWDTPSNSANTFWTGCGFIFRYLDDYNFYGVMFNADGDANMFRWVGGPSFLNYGHYGKVPLHKGSVTLTIVAEGEDFTIFVNGKKMTKVHDVRNETGALGYLLFSGTNMEPGTTCRWSNTAYWELP
jgi:hypothetical protein